MTTTAQFFDEVVASAILMFMIYALKDDGNIGMGSLTPLGREYYLGRLYIDQERLC